MKCLSDETCDEDIEEDADGKVYVKLRASSKRYPSILVGLKKVINAEVERIDKALRSKFLEGK